MTAIRGRRRNRFLEEEFKDYPVIELNPKGLQADNRGVDKVMKQLDYCDRGLSSVSVDVLVAIGAGTIHDLTRYAATEYDIPFVSVRQQQVWMDLRQMWQH